MENRIIKGLTTEDLKKLYSHTLEDKFFTFTIGNQKVPVFFYHERTGIFNKVNELRNLLLKTRLEHEKKFGRDYNRIIKFSDNKPEYIEQFPILITKSKVWKSICSEVGCNKNMKDNKGNKYWDRSLFVLDYYIPKLKIAIELDYNSSHNCPEYDKARDMYIKEEYDIDTVRFRDYELDPDLTRQARNTVNKLVAEMEIQEEKQVAKVASFIRFPLRYYKDELDVLEAIRSENRMNQSRVIKLKHSLSKYYILSKHKKTNVSLNKLYDLLEKLEIKVEE